MDEQIKETYAKYGRLLTSLTWNMARLMGLSPSELKCLILEGIWRALKTFDVERGEFKPHLVMSTLSLVRTEYRNHNRKKRLPRAKAVSIDEYFEDRDGRKKLLKVQVIDSKVDIFAEVWGKELFEQVESLCSEFEARVLQHHIHGFSLNESADILGVSKKAVDNARNRIRTKVQTHLSPREEPRIFEDTLTKSERAVYEMGDMNVSDMAEALGICKRSVYRVKRNIRTKRERWEAGS